MKTQKMYIILFGIFIIKLQISVSEPQFPPHIDLQKVGEAIFNNEKFNILKPTTHRVTDHFKDFMLRTESSYHPAKRIFIDNNGFRHDWSGFGEKSKSLRKTDLKHVSESFENTPQSDIILKDDNNNTATVEDISDNNLSSNGNENNNQEVENNASDNYDTVQNLTEKRTETPENKETTTIINLFPTIQKKYSSTKITTEERLRQGRDNAKQKPNTTKKPVDGRKNALASGVNAERDDKPKDDKVDEKKPNVNGERTVATTTFFCPYFGTITMSAFID